jgi:hypothetical protein
LFEEEKRSVKEENGSWSEDEIVQEAARRVSEILKKVGVEE